MPEKRMKVLLIDDEPHTLYDEQYYLEMTLKAELTVAHNVSKATEHLKKSRFRLIIMDQYLPDVEAKSKDELLYSGKKILLFLRDCKHENVGVPVILITARNVQKILAAFAESGIKEGAHYSAMLSKPFKEDEFENAVQYALEK